MHMNLFFRMGSGNKRGEMAENTESCEMRSSGAVARCTEVCQSQQTEDVGGAADMVGRGWGMNAFSDSYTVCSIPGAGFAVFRTISVGGHRATTV